ncbi:MAG: zinc ribbon domain-containing protein [Clostridia bacterium]|nr:zinc ribbon domain-containing protein [Clostridia bacterium]
MFCPKCGKMEADGTAFCSACGAAMTATAQNPNAEAPKAGGFRPSAKDRGLSKKEFLAQEAGPAAKKNALLSLAAFALAALFLIITLIATCNMAFYDIPIFNLALTASGADVDEMDDAMDELADELDDLRDYVDDFEDELDLDSDELELVNDLFDEMENMVRNPSLSNVLSAVEETRNIANKSLPEELEDRLVGSDMDEFDAVADTLSIIQTVLIIFTFLVIALAALAAFMKNMGFAIAAIIVNALPCLLLSGVIWFLLITASLVVLCVFLSKFNAEYKALQPIKA